MHMNNIKDLDMNSDFTATSGPQNKGEDEISKPKNGKKSSTRQQITVAFIRHICDLYGDYYDDREENSSIGGEDWKPGQRADHKSLRIFKEELEKFGMKLSTGKIRKILITGGVYSTELSRSVKKGYENFEVDAVTGRELTKKERIVRTAEALEISPKTVSMYLPYERQVYKEERSEAAKSQKKWRDKKRNGHKELIALTSSKIGKCLNKAEIQQLKELNGTELREMVKRL